MWCPSNHLILNGRVGLIHFGDSFILPNDIGEWYLTFTKDRTKVFVYRLHRLGPILGVDGRHIIRLPVSRFELSEFPHGADRLKCNVGSMNYPTDTSLMAEIKGEELKMSFGPLVDGDPWVRYICGAPTGLCRRGKCSSRASDNLA
jgi:hypothetical protein